MLKIFMLIATLGLLAVNTQRCEEETPRSAPENTTAEASAEASAAISTSNDEARWAGAKVNYANYCAGCHGEQMQAFVDRKWTHGNSKNDLYVAIKQGYPDDGMPAFDTTFTEKELTELVAYILEGIENDATYKFQDETLNTSTFPEASSPFRMDTIYSGDNKLKSPWGMTFLPGGDMLVTEKSGTLFRLTANKSLVKIGGVPEVVDRGQGGLMDVELHPQFASNQLVYLTYSRPHDTDKSLATTAILRARLDGNELKDQQVIFEALPYAKTRHHYGSRLEFDRDGYLFFSVGDRGNREENPQSLDNHCGKIHRIKDDGSIPEDNPFVKQAGAMPSIWSYGHRNPQGLAMHPVTGVMWNHEHGPRGGDEVNIIEKGKNYGWPTISYGINYNGTTFTQKTAMEGMEQPELYWTPSIAPCGATFVKGERYPNWENDFMVGSLRFKYLNRCDVEDNKIVGEEKLMKNIGRMRAVEMSPDGYLYVSVENPGAIYRLVPLSN